MFLEIVGPENQNELVWGLKPQILAMNQTLQYKG